MKITLSILLVFLILLMACNSRRHIIERIVSQFDTSDLGPLRNLCVHFRSAGLHTYSSIYFLSVYNKDCSPYAIEVDNHEKKILEINNGLVMKSCGGEILKRQDIVNAMKKYFELDVCLICVDQQGNVYVNPTEQKRPTVLRKVNGSQPKDFAEFNHYKNDWYVRSGTLE